MRRALGILTVLAVMGLVSGVSAGEKPVRLGLALQTVQNPFYLSLKAGAEKAAAEIGNVQVISVGAENSVDLATQVKQVEDFIQMKVDVIGIVAIERKGIIPTIEKANRAGIPVITVDTDADGGKREAYIATDNVLGGRLGAEWIIKALDGKGRIAVLEGAPGSQVNDLRLSGFREAMGKAKGIQIVSSLAANWRRDTGMNVMNDILTAHPDINAVMALNDEMALGALEAIKVRGKARQVLLIGYNGAAEAIQQVYKGAMAADVVQYPERIGDLFVRWSLRILKGEKPPTFHIDSGVNVVDSVLLQKVVPAALQGR